MSRLRVKLLIAAMCLTFVTATPAFAQLSQMRLFSPYPDDQFGGGAYMNEGFYGTIGAGMVFITAPPDQIVGDPFGSQAAVSNTIGGANATSVATSYPTASQINTGTMRTPWTSATEFEVGNQRGHHGWFVKGTVVSPQKMDMSGYDAGIVLYDPPVINVENIYGANTNYYVWSGNATAPLYELNMGLDKQIGRLWGIVGLFGSGTSGNTYSGGGSTGGNTQNQNNKYAFVPIPLTFDQWKLSSSVNTWGVEAMYNYRLHPFRRGVLELMAGARYTCFDEAFNVFGHSTTKLTTQYSDTRIEILLSGSAAAAGGQAVTSTSQAFTNNTQNQTYELGADLGYSVWNFQAENHLVGPQLGLRYTLSNNRWRFTNESKAFLALNRQNLYADGELGLKPSASQNTNLSQTNGTPLYAPIGTVQNRIGYSYHLNEFSPGADIKFEAAWHWTHAVSFKFGYQALYLTNIARASAINYYKMNENGTIFDIKEDKKDRNFDTFVHGAMFTVQINK